MYNEITVIIVTFNSDYNVLNRCINSIDNNIQIIIVDNSSNLESKNIENYKTKKIKIIKNENTGNGDGINIGVDNCNSKYVLYLDVDTQLPEKFFVKKIPFLFKIQTKYKQNAARKFFWQKNSFLFKIQKKYKQNAARKIFWQKKIPFY